MKRIIALLITIVLTLCLCMTGCEGNSGDTSSSRSQSEPTSSESGETNGHKIPTATTVDRDSLSANEGETINLSEIGLNNLVVNKKTNGHSTDGEGSSYAYILSDYRYSSKNYHDSYLAVETGGKILVYDLKNAAHEDFLYLADVDGDGKDEVIVHQATDNFGGVGQYISRVFKIEGDIIGEIFTSQNVGLAEDTYNVFDTGFESEFLEGYKLKIINTVTSYSTIIDISDKYADEFFDENGKGKSEWEIGCDSFMLFAPKDVDDDGIFEIECVQYAYLQTRGNGIGYTNTVLEFDPDTQKWEIISAAFSQSIE